MAAAAKDFEEETMRKGVEPKSMVEDREAAAGEIMCLCVRAPSYKFARIYATICTSCL